MVQDAATLAVVLEECPSCHSQDIHAVEPGFFVLDPDREEARDTWVERVEFSCRACGIVWC